MDPLPPCPYSHKGGRKAHNLSVLMPEKSKHPVGLFCDRCGTVRMFTLRQVPLDDYTAADIERLAARIA